MPANLLLEIGCEEIPSRYLPSAIEQLQEVASGLLGENRIGYRQVESWATPRRLVLHVEEVAERQEDLTEKLKGPPVDKAFDSNGEPTKAAQGFARSVGVEIEDLEREVINQGEYLVAVKEIEGKPVKELLPELMPQLIDSIRFPRSMFWERGGTRFARPVRWLMCLFGQETINFQFAGVSSGKLTYGHRILAPGPFEVPDANSYFQIMEDSYVILDEKRRQEIIEQLVEDKAAENQGKPIYTPELIEEVCFLVEYPVVIQGSFARDFLRIPREVLITTMQVHQKFFPVVSRSNEQLLPIFLGISNNLYSDYTRRGYEKVLHARLADADFFYREDTRFNLEENVPKLKKVLFQESLGSLYNKSLRIQGLVDYAGSEWDVLPEVLERARRAAYLCKADLVTQVVKEFPELQGTMGKEYALLSGEEEGVASALYEHYLPRFSGDDLPSSQEGALVALGDKIDTLAGCFYAGIQPTGSHDPYALRRQAVGVISILLKREVPVSLPDLIKIALQQVENNAQIQNPEDTEVVFKSLHEFLEQRIRYIFQEEKGLSHHVVEAVLAVPYEIIDHLYRRAKVISSFMEEDYFEDLLTSYTRVNNLARKAGSQGEVDASLLQESAEQELWEVVLKTEKDVEAAWINNDYPEVLTILSHLRKPIDDFFDQVMVMSEDEEVRNNRLHLLQRIRQLFNRYADFSYLHAA